VLSASVCLFDEMLGLPFFSYVHITEHMNHLAVVARFFFQSSLQG